MMLDVAESYRPQEMRGRMENSDHAIARIQLSHVAAAQHCK